MRPRSVPGSKHFGQRNVMKINDLSFWKWPYMAERGRETAKQASVLSWTVKNFLQSPDWPLSVPHAFSSFKLWWKGRVKPCFVTQEKSRQHSMQGGQHLSECFYWFLWLHKLKNVEAYHKNWKLLHTVLVVNFRFFTRECLYNSLFLSPLSLTVQFLFVLVNGALKSNERSLEYFGLSSRDLPRVGLYDVDLDKKWLMPKGQITKDAVRAFCQSFLDGELQVRRRCTCCLRSFTQVTEVVTNCHKIMYAHTCKQSAFLINWAIGYLFGVFQRVE